jgi:hypothetical protein
VVVKGHGGRTSVNFTPVVRYRIEIDHRPILSGTVRDALEVAPSSKYGEGGTRTNVPCDERKR